MTREPSPGETDPLDPDLFEKDPEARLYSGELLEDEDGNPYRPQQMNVGADNMEGHGEYPGDQPARAPAPGAIDEPERTERKPR